MAKLDLEGWEGLARGWGRGGTRVPDRTPASKRPIRGSLARPPGCAAQPLSEPSTMARSGPKHTPVPAPSGEPALCSLGVQLPPRALGAGDTGPPCWDARLAADSPSTYHARLLTGRRSTCFPRTSSPVGAAVSRGGGGTTEDLRGWGGGGGTPAARSDGTTASGRRHAEMHGGPWVLCLQVVPRDLRS